MKGFVVGKWAPQGMGGAQFPRIGHHARSPSLTCSFASNPVVMNMKPMAADPCAALTRRESTGARDPVPLPR